MFLAKVILKTLISFKVTLARNNDLRIETFWRDFKCFNVKFYVSAFVGVIIKVILQNARCNNKDNKLFVVLNYLKNFVSPQKMV